MKSRSTSVIVAALAAMISASPAQAGGLKQVAKYRFPAYRSTTSALSSSTRRRVLAISPTRATSRSSSSIPRPTSSSRASPASSDVKDGDASGPNGVVVVNGGAELWVSDGDSTIKVIELKTGKITSTISTGGKKRANAMAYDPKTRVVIVANPNDEPPFLSLISTEPGHKILAKIPVRRCGREPGALGLSCAVRHVLHGHPGAAHGSPPREGSRRPIRRPESS